MDRLFEGMSDPSIIAQLEDDYAETFSELLEAPEEPEQDLMGEMDDETGQTGVDEFCKLSTDELRSMLGLNKGHEDSPVFPFFNAWVSDVGKLPEDIPGFEAINWKDKTSAEASAYKLRELRPQWHQYVGLAAIVKQLRRGNNVLLADGVGVGKTMECLMTVAYMRYLRLLGPALRPEICEMDA